MSPMFLSSLIALGGLGLIFGAGLAYAARKFAVEVDPKVEHIIEILPGANCGACGQPGCSAFAEAVVAGRIPPNKCVPGGQETAGNDRRGPGIYQVTIVWRGTASITNASNNACGAASGNYGDNLEFRRIIQVPTYIDPNF